MKKVLIILATAFMVILGASTAGASSRVRTDQFMVAKDQVVNGNQYISADQIVIDGVVNGDLVASAQKITINGKVAGSLLAISGEVMINGTVEGSVRTASQALTISGAVNQDVTSLARTITLEKDAAVKDSVMISAAETHLNGSIEGITRQYVWDNRPEPSVETRIYRLLGQFLALALFGVVLYAAQASPQTFFLFNHLRNKGLVALGVGFLSLVFIPLLSLLLLLTPVGRVLGLAVLLVFVLLILLAIVDASYFLGRLLLDRNQELPKTIIGHFLVGLLLICAVWAIPLLALFPALLLLAALGNRIMVLRSVLINHTLPLS